MGNMIKTHFRRRLRKEFQVSFALILFFGFFALADVSHSATYYVDFDSGNDANNGTSQSGAWKHAPGDYNATGVPAERGYYHNPLLPGDTVLLKGGGSLQRHD